MTNSPWQLKLLFDGKCPLCSREMAVLHKKNKHGRLAFEDIADPAFDPNKYGLTMPEVVGAMHAVRPDGTVLRGVDVFAETYDAVGWHWLAAPIRWRITRPFAKLIYRLFATIRPSLSSFQLTACDERCRPTGGRTAVVGFWVVGLVWMANGCSSSPPAVPTTAPIIAASQPLPSTTQESETMKSPIFFSEAKLPEGFPPPGAVDQVIVKEYPASRAAVVQASAVKSESEGGMFRSLFNHIKSHDIPMSAPVDMTWSDPAKSPGEEKTVAMAFVYRDPSTGKPGADGVVNVVDLPARTFVSVGVRGSYDRAHFEKGMKQIQAWLSARADVWTATGAPRYLGYNSPFVPWFMKYGEVQVPVSHP